MKAKKVKAKKKGNGWRNFKIRFSLFRIWFMKNLLVFLNIFLVVLLVLILTGVVNKDTPLLGSTVYVLFAPLADEINRIIAEKEINDVMTFLSVLISVFISVGMFSLKAKSIAQSDIKNKKLKLALVSAGLYFNKEGKLVKKVEKATGTDLDGDGKADEGEPEVSRGFFRGIFHAIKEFFVIMSVKVDEDKSVEENVKEIVEENNMEAAAEATEEVQEIVEDGVTEMIAAAVVGATEGQSVEESVIELTKEDVDEEKVQKVSIFKRILNWFKDIPERAKARKEERRRKKEEKQAQQEAIKDESSASDVDVLVNDMDSDAVDTDDTKEEETVKEDKKETEEPKTEASTKVEEPKKEEKKSAVDSKEAARQALLDSIRNRKK